MEFKYTYGQPLIVQDSLGTFMGRYVGTYVIKVDGKTRSMITIDKDFIPNDLMGKFIPITEFFNHIEYIAPCEDMILETMQIDYPDELYVFRGYYDNEITVPISSKEELIHQLDQEVNDTN